MKEKSFPDKIEIHFDTKGHSERIFFISDNKKTQGKLEIFLENINLELASNTHERILFESKMNALFNQKHDEIRFKSHGLELCYVKESYKSSIEEAKNLFSKDNDNKLIYGDYNSILTYIRK